MAVMRSERARWKKISLTTRAIGTRMADDVHGVMGFMLYVSMGNVADDDNDDDDDLGCEGRFHY